MQSMKEDVQPLFYCSFWTYLLDIVDRLCEHSLFFLQQNLKGAEKQNLTNEALCYIDEQSSKKSEFNSFKFAHNFYARCRMHKKRLKYAIIIAVYYFAVCTLQINKGFVK